MIRPKLVSRVAVPILLIVVAPLTAMPAMAKASGILCIAPVGKNEVSDLTGKRLPAFTIRVNSGPPVNVDPVRMVRVAVPGQGRNLIRIYAHGRLAESFYFRLSDYGSHVVKLVNDATGYQTWRLMEGKSCR